MLLDIEFVYCVDMGGRRVHGEVWFGVMPDHACQKYSVSISGGGLIVISPEGQIEPSMTYFLYPA